MRILIVDDDHFILQTLAAVLEGEGHSIAACTGGQQGIDAFNLAQAGDPPYSLVITDASMPEVDGHQLVAAVKASSPSTPVILFTGSLQAAESRNYESFKEDPVLSKPPNMSELRLAVARFSGRMTA
jgi:CheY-like chemotaxis protein